MKKSKITKSLCLLMASAMCVGSFAGCGDSTDSGDDTTTTTEAQKTESESSSEGSSDASGLAEMTTEDIELTYMHFDNATLCDYLAEKFMDKYPNIKVTCNYVTTDVYNDTLLNLVGAGQTPDCFMILGNCDFALSNDILGDMTEYWENDPENENVLESINEAKIGYYGTDTKYATPMKFFPGAIYADMNVFNKLNLTMPSTEWTWDEMVQSIKDATDTSQGIYGFNNFYSFVTFYPIYADANCIGEFGWDGTTFNMSNWADGLNEWASLINGGYHAPYGDTDEMEAWSGARDTWAAYTGNIAYQVDAWWTYLNLFDTEDYLNKGIEFVPYTTPANDSGYTFGVLDMGGISSNTEHPREAYELLKWMGWGAEGWEHKATAYTTMSEGDVPLYRCAMPLPITLDEGIWASVRELYPSGDDPKAAYFDAFFENCKKPIPFGDCEIPGFAAFIADAYSGIEDDVINNGADAHDYADELAEKAAEYNKQAMEEDFQ